MAYIINSYDGTHITTVCDRTINTTLDITLIGRKYMNYGEIQNENFVFLLENFANAEPPPKAVVGQIWYDTQSNKLRFVNTSNQWRVVNGAEGLPVPYHNPAIGDFWYDTTLNKLKFRTNTNQWRVANGAEPSDTPPTNSAIGDFWYDSLNDKVYVYDGTSYISIESGIPEYGDTSMQSRLITDTTNHVHAVIEALVGINSTDERSVALFSADPTYTINRSVHNDSELIGFTNVYKGITLVNTNSNGITPIGDRFWGTATDSDRLGGIEANQYITINNIQNLITPIINAINEIKDRLVALESIT